MSKTVGTITTPFVWDVSGALPTLLKDGSTDYVYGPGGLPLEQISGTSVLWLHHDQLGSTRVITNSTGNTVGTYIYDSYGNLTASTGTVQVALLYAGQYRDSETGLYYLRARYYDPTTAQFVGVDPAAATTLARYGYVGGDPLNHEDPSGAHSRPVTCYKQNSQGSSNWDSTFTTQAATGESAGEACQQVDQGEWFTGYVTGAEVGAPTPDAPGFNYPLFPGDVGYQPGGGGSGGGASNDNNSWNEQGGGQAGGASYYWGGGQGCVGPFINGAEFAGGELIGLASEAIDWFLRLCQAAEIASNPAEKLIGPCGVA